MVAMETHVEYMEYTSFIKAKVAKMKNMLH